MSICPQSSSGPAPWARSLLILALCSWGCAALDEPEPEDPAWSRNNCSVDADCTTGVCDSELKLCVVDSIDFENRVFYFQVVPPPSYGVARLTEKFVISLVDQNTQAGYTLVRKQDVLLKTVKDSGDELATRLVFYNRSNQVPGWSAPVTTVDVSASTQGVLRQLEPGQYDVAVKVINPISNNEHYPDIFRRGDQITSSTETLEISVPKAELIVEGVIKRGFTPANDLFVWAERNGKNPRIISTVATTSCKDGGSQCGWFQIGLPTNTVDFELKVRHKREAAYPQNARNIEVKDLTGDYELSLPPLSPPVSTRLKVNMPDPHAPASGDLVPAPKCTVVFSADLAEGTVQVSTRTNEAGEIEEQLGYPGLNLYPGTYTIAVYPPEATTVVDYGIATIYDVTVEPPDQDPSNPLELATITLPVRPRIAGNIEVGGSPMKNLPITGAPSYFSDRKDVERPSSAATDFFGHYQLWLDDTVVSLPYLVTAAPPSNSGYPWFLWEQEVPLDETKIVDIQIPIPLKFDIQLDGLSGEEELYEELEVFVYEQLYDEENFAALVGKGYTNSEGQVSLLLNPYVLSTF